VNRLGSGAAGAFGPAARPSGRANGGEEATMEKEVCWIGFAIDEAKIPFPLVVNEGGRRVPPVRPPSEFDLPEDTGALVLMSAVLLSEFLPDRVAGRLAQRFLRDVLAAAMRTAVEDAMKRTIGDDALRVRLWSRAWMIWWAARAFRDAKRDAEDFGTTNETEEGANEA
jgi:hypothetical protein